MALTETQISGLNKKVEPILEDDLRRIFGVLGLRRVPCDEPETLLHQMKITSEWTANARCHEIRVERMPSRYVVHFFVNHRQSGKALGPVYQIEDANVLQRMGARVMSEMFESVDDLTPFKCPTCDDGLLTWDGKMGRSLTSKPGMRCTGCGWTGHTGHFAPLREFR